MLQTFVGACCPTVAEVVAATGCPDGVGYVPETRRCRRIPVYQIPECGIPADTGRLRTVDSSSGKLLGVVVRMLPASDLGRGAGKPAGQLAHRLELPAVDTDDAVGDAVNAVTAANKPGRQSCGVVITAAGITEAVQWQVLVAVVVGKVLRWPRDDCNSLQGLGGAGAGAGVGAGMCSVGVSFCRVQVEVVLVGL